MKFLAAIVALFLLFLSGTTPYSLVYDEAGFKKLGSHDGAIDEKKFVCQTDKNHYEPGELIHFTYSYEIVNPTNRFVIFSVISDIMPPDRPAITKYKNLLLSPGETYSAKYTQSIEPLPRIKKSSSFGEDEDAKIVYGCEIRANVGLRNYS